MPTPLSIELAYAAPAAQVFALLQDEAFIRGRLANTGGGEPTVAAFVVTPNGVAMTLTQTIPAAVLPGIVASFFPGDPVTERTEHWTRTDAGYTATFAVEIKGAPAALNGTMTLADAAAGGSTFRVQGQASVPIPFVGGRIESLIVEQVQTLLERDHTYTAAALAG